LQVETCSCEVLQKHWLTEYLLSLFTTHTAAADEAEEVVVVATVTGHNGNTPYARQLMEQDELDESSTKTVTADIDADVKETTAGEVDNETRRRVEGQIEDLILADTVEEKANVEERHKDVETPGEQQLTEDTAAEEAEGEMTSDAGACTLAEGRTVAIVNTVTSSYM